MRLVTRYIPEKCIAAGVPAIRKNSENSSEFYVMGICIAIDF